MAIKSDMPLLSSTNHLRSLAFFMKKKNDRELIIIYEFRSFIVGIAYSIIFLFIVNYYIYQDDFKVVAYVFVTTFKNCPKRSYHESNNNW